MRKNLASLKVKIIILMVFVNSSYSQSIVGVVMDSISGNKLPYANVVLINGKGTFSDEFGKFEISLNKIKNDTLKISYLGYKSKFLPITKTLAQKESYFYLQPKIESLEEVIISNKKIRYTDKERLGEKRLGNIGMTSLIGYQTCILISNPRKTKGRIKRAYVNLKKRKNADYMATFNIKFYQYDLKKNEPGKELYHKNIYVEPKNRKYRLWIDVEQYNIVYPENGACVCVEMVNKIGEVKKYAYFGPMFRYTLSSDRNIKTWSNYHNTGWKGVSNKHKRYKNYKTGRSIPMIGVEVLFPAE